MAGSAEITLRLLDLPEVKAVVEAARLVNREWGHNLPGWVECAQPDNCAWAQLEKALIRLDNATSTPTAPSQSDPSTGPSDADAAC